MEKLRALFIDLDGCLAASTDVLKTIYAQFMAAHGLAASESEWTDIVGRAVKPVMQTLKNTHNIAEDVDSLANDFTDRMAAAYPLQARPSPGAAELLAEASRLHLFISVVTSSPRKVVTGFLGQHGLSSFVSAVVAAEDISKGKPDPEPYLIALKTAGVSRKEAIAVEDSYNGALSAIQAGLSTFLYVAGREGPQVPGVYGVIKSLKNLIPIIAESHIDSPK